MGEFVSHFPKYLFASNHLHFSRTNLIDPALDLFRPSCFHSCIGRFIRYALNQAIDEHTALVGRKNQSFIQQLGGFWG